MRTYMLDKGSSEISDFFTFCIDEQSLNVPLFDFLTSLTFCSGDF